jgi:TPR repeat protein
MLTIKGPWVSFTGPDTRGFRYRIVIQSTGPRCKRKKSPRWDWVILGAIALWESGSLQDDKSAHKKKVEEARQYYEDAYLNGLFQLGGDRADPLAADLLGDYYFISRPPAPKEMERHYRVAISKGYPRSMAALGFHQMIGGVGIPKNPKAAVYLFEKATKQELPDGFMNLGVAYLRGDGVPQDLTKALKLIIQASDRGHEKAKEALAAVLEEQTRQYLDLLERSVPEANPVDPDSGCLPAQA